VRKTDDRDASAVQIALSPLAFIFLTTFAAKLSAPVSRPDR
jgi:hypothetical protein